MNRPLAVAIGVMADRAFGEPPLRPHPVSLLGSGLHQLERLLYADRRIAGVAYAATGIGIGWLAGSVLRSVAVSTYLAVAGRALRDAAGNVRSSLEEADLDDARSRLPALVGRDPAQLDEPEVCRAVVESVAENTVDAIMAPVFWAVAAGAPGVVVHRVVNTMDAMVGYRNERYGRYGWAAARLDDAAAWAPARITAALVAVCRPTAARRVIQIVRRDAAAHPSPNAGVAEAAFAAALGVRLGGPASYGGRIEVRPYLGDGRAPSTSDISRAIRLSRDVSYAAVLFLALTGLTIELMRRGCRRPRAEP